METTELAIRENCTLTVQDVRKQVEIIRSLLDEVLVKGIHYGVIPGCGNKPTLLKPGAEKILMTFQFGVDPTGIDDLSTEKGFRFRIKTRIFDRVTDLTLGYGIGECSTLESKFRHKFGQGDSNTILKMAKKRALVDGVLTITAASDLFTQDIEDHENPPNGKTVVPPSKKNFSAEEEKIGKEITQMQKEMNPADSERAETIKIYRKQGAKAALDHVAKSYSLFLDSKAEKKK